MATRRPHGVRTVRRTGRTLDASRPNAPLTTANFPVSDAAMVRGSITLIVLALVMPSLAAAETMSFGDAIGMLAKSCGAEIVANCRGVNPDSTRLKECLARNRDLLSPHCPSDYLD